MAIKGKAKARSRPKQVARAPRREPVEVKPPLFQRRWVQLSGVFVLGLLAMAVVVWVWSGLHREHQQREAANAASIKRAAAQRWETTVSDTLTRYVGTSSQPGLVPTAFPEMGAALTSMKKGSPPAGAAEVFSKAATNAQAAANALTKFGVVDTIRNKGFTAEQATAFADSSDELVAALNLYQQAAQTAGAAVKADGALRTELTALAQETQTRATAALQQAWSTYQDALSGGGIVQTPLSPTSG